MRLVSANVNGIRAAARRDGLTWLAEQQPDLVTLQEVRATEQHLRSVLADTLFEGWGVALCPGPAGRAGVAVLTPDPPEAVRGEAVLGDVPGAEGRWIEVDTVVDGVGLTVASCYMHTGEAGTARQADKYALLDAVEQRLAALEASGRHAVVTGDLNICHRQADLRNWKGNRGKSGFLPEEQEYLSRWLGAGWVDVVRDDAGDVDGPYTWWSWRGKAFDNDAGWRIDYQFATAALARSVTGVGIGRAASYAERWSDHAAVVVDYGLGELTVDRSQTGAAAG